MEINSDVERAIRGLEDDWQSWRAKHNLYSTIEYAIEEMGYALKKISIRSGRAMFDVQE